ncbi:hypothetical protein D3C75_1346780 [compost metagenome]
MGNPFHKGAGKEGNDEQQDQQTQADNKRCRLDNTPDIHRQAAAGSKIEHPPAGFGNLPLDIHVFGLPVFEEPVAAG